MCTTATSSHSFRKTRVVVTSLFVILMLAFGVHAQSPIDNTTPPGQAPGAPAGSYALDGFDNVNLFNGHLNFALPVMTINGRGQVGYTVTLPIEQRWITESVDPSSFVPVPNWWSTAAGYAPGILEGRQTSEGCFDYTSYVDGTTRLTFTMPNKTEYELIDQVYGGQPALSHCGAYAQDQFNGTSRGTTFVTRDGTSATFVSDQPIKDLLFHTTVPYYIYPTGYLMLRDGTRYRIVSGRVQWMRDRNGNKLTFTYDSYNRILSVTDSMNRVVTFDYAVADAQCGTCDRINFKGAGGVSRKIWIVYKPLGQALASGQSLKVYSGPNGLFPELTGSTTTQHNPTLLATVILPDTRTYQFYYNSYGELAKVKLPTGGAIVYDWGPGTEGGVPSGVTDYNQIYRRVLERRTYTDDGVTLASHTSFGRYSSLYGPEGSAWIKHRDIDGSQTILSQSKHTFISGPLNYINSPSGGWLPPLLDGREKQTEDYNASGTTVLRRSTSTWTNGGTLAGVPINPRVTQTVDTIEPSGANLVSKQTFSYDTYNNKTDVYEYGFGTGAAGSLVRRTHTDYLTLNSVTGTNYATSTTIHLRSLPTLQQVFDGGGVQRARTAYEYDNYAADANHAGLVSRPSISGLDSSFTTSYASRGNVTAATAYFLNVSGAVTGSIVAYQQYDQAGNLVKSIDGRGYATQFDFSDRFGTADGNAQANSGATELGSQVSYAFATKITNAVSHIGYSQFDYYVGKPVDAEDANAVVSSLYYNDALDRLTQVRRAVGSSSSNQTTFAYDDGNRIITTSSDRDNFGDNILVSKTLYDGLGRTTESRQYEGGSNYIVTQKQYDALNRVFKSSNPYRPWQSQTAVWTTQAFDALGRVTSVTTPDNAVVTTSYTGNTMTLTDQAGKAKKSVMDALGRLTDVYEDPGGLNYQTTYNYDVLDNLVKVTQGTQQRFFMYDSLKRLIRARNPEQSTNAALALTDPISGNSAWSIGYQYDSNGNVTLKTDARAVETSYVYDALNRATNVNYSDATPDVSRQYDNAISGKGRVNQIWQSGSITSATYIDSYDPLGRPLIQRQRFETSGVWSDSYQTQRAYNRAGGVTSQTYPSGRTVSYTYDEAGRTSSFTGTLGDGLQRTYATGISYSQWGAPSFEQYGTNISLYHKLQYNIRGQLFDTRVSSVSDLWDWNRGRLILYYSSNHVWGQSGTDNNGNVRFAEIWVPPDNATLDQAHTLMEDTYNYDALNRLASVAEQRISVTNGWVWQQQFRQAYDYDRYGNRTINTDPAQTWGTGINNKSFTVDTATNRLTVPVGQPGSMTYDAAGNLTTDTYSSFGSRVFDAENKITAAQDNLGGWSYYTYDGDGRRTRRKINNQETWQIYGFDGELLAEYAASGATASPQKEYGYRNGQLLVTTAGASCGAGYVGTKSWSATSPSLGHNTGQAESSDWATYVSTHSSGHMAFGPYDTSFGKGRHKAWFQLQVDNTSGTDVVATLDVVVGLGTNVLAQRQVRRNEFTAANTWQWFSVDFDHPCFGQVEARIYWHDTVNMKFRETQINYAGQGGAIVNWLVADHLGTPRMIFDQAGSYATMKRHDYLPFGEELFVPAGGRSTSLGYTGGDGVRQQYASKERDVETGLDYFIARYYSSTQGRFTSIDPVYIEVERLADPQQLNLYSHGRNNPLKFLDPTGLDITVNGTDQDAYINRLQEKVSFEVRVNRTTNKVEIVDAKGNVLDKKALEELGKTLKGGAKELFNAITDTNNHVTIDTVRGDANVDFGRFDGRGKNTVDAADLDVLDDPQNACGLTSSDVVAHETLEAYKAAQTGATTPNDPHAYANRFYGGLELPDPTTLRVYGTSATAGAPAMIHRVSVEFPIHNRLGRQVIHRQFLTPIPQNAIPRGHIPAHIIKVEWKK